MVAVRPQPKVVLQARQQQNGVTNGSFISGFHNSNVNNMRLDSNLINRDTHLKYPDTEMCGQLLLSSHQTTTQAPIHPVAPLPFVPRSIIPNSNKIYKHPVASASLNGIKIKINRNNNAKISTPFIPDNPSVIPDVEEKEQQHQQNGTIHRHVELLRTANGHNLNAIVNYPDSSEEENISKSLDTSSNEHIMLNTVVKTSTRSEPSVNVTNDMSDSLANGASLNNGHDENLHNGGDNRKRRFETDKDDDKDDNCPKKKKRKKGRERRKQHNNDRHDHSRSKHNTENAADRAKVIKSRQSSYHSSDMSDHKSRVADKRRHDHHSSGSSKFRSSSPDCWRQSQKDESYHSSEKHNHNGFHHSKSNSLERRPGSRIHGEKHHDGKHDDRHREQIYDTATVQKSSKKSDHVPHTADTSTLHVERDHDEKSNLSKHVGHANLDKIEELKRKPISREKRREERKIRKKLKKSMKREAKRLENNISSGEIPIEKHGSGFINSTLKPALLSPLEFLKAFYKPNVKSWDGDEESKDNIYSSSQVDSIGKHSTHYDDEFDMGKTKKIRLRTKIDNENKQVTCTNLFQQTLEAKNKKA